MNNEASAQVSAKATFDTSEGAARNPPPPAIPKLRFCELEFSGGEKFQIKDNGIVVFVGPNNGGKSSSLGGVFQSFALGPQRGNEAVKAQLAQISEKTIDEVVAYITWADPILSGTTRIGPGGNYNGDPQYLKHPNGLHEAWQRIAGHFIKFCSCRGREQSLNITDNYNPMDARPTAPLQFLARDPTAVKKISALISDAFGLDFFIFSNGPKIYPYLGVAPKILPGETEKSATYVDRFKASGRPADQNGDGVVFFTSLVVTIVSSETPIILIDEPEAFLHPPQARLLGRALARNLPVDSQLFIATHSTDFLQGLLEGHQDRVHVVRITRSRDRKKNHAKELPPAQLAAAWKSPLVRHTSILDGVFHGLSVIAEADGDCDLFRAIASALPEFQQPGAGVPDVFFIPVMGNSRLSEAAGILRACGVRPVISTDFDTLSNQQLIRAIYESLGGSWTAISADYAAVANYITNKTHPGRTAAIVQAQISAEIPSLPDDPIPDAIRSRIGKLLKQPSAWRDAKSAGTTIIQDATIKDAWDRLAADFAKVGLFVVPVGEIESFAPWIRGKHGPTFVAELLETVSLGNDPRLDGARGYVRAMLKA